MKVYIYEIGFGTDKGNVRKQNQDSLIVNKGSIGKDDFVLMAVADGMGGLSSGEKASHAAIASLKNWWNKDLPNIINSSDYIKKIDANLEVLIENINNKILSIGKDESRASGTTLSLIFIHKNNYILKHIGDSRIYLINNYKIKQLTKDQTWCAKEIENGNITTKEAENHKMRHVLLSALGTGRAFEVQSEIGELPKNSRIFICSDGLYNFMSKEQILKFISRKDKPQDIVWEMIRFVKNTEANDNITAILFDVKVKWTAW